MLKRLLRTDGPGVYIAVLLVTVAATMLYSLRADGVFACQSGYGPGQYLAYCNVEGYGEYDHGAFWFELEPDTHAAAREAEVIFLGNSRLQFAFSTASTERWFKERSMEHYLLGFSENERYRFEEELMTRIGARPRAYVVNVDRFFEDSVSPSARQLMLDNSAKDRLERKRVWQQLHVSACGKVPALCGREYAIFRSRDTGAWTRAGRLRADRKPASDDPALEHDRLRRESAIARTFIHRLGVPESCVILTMVPTANGRRAHAQALAQALGAELVSPALDGLDTFDGSHLDDRSAERWSAAFFEQAGDRIASCVSPAQRAGN
jgi:hypothetical protein